VLSCRHGRPSVVAVRDATADTRLCPRRDFATSPIARIEKTYITFLSLMASTGSRIAMRGSVGEAETAGVS